MTDSLTHPDLSGRHILIPGGTGGVGEGAVRAYLAAGADVVVPTRSTARADEFRTALGDAASEHLHLVVHDYTTFAGAEELVNTMVMQLGSVDDVVAPIGGWWSGKRLWEIDEDDWQSAFVGLATTHMAVLRAALPRMTAQGAYSIVVGQSAHYAVPGSGLVSMEQSALAMMQQVLAAELGGSKRVFLLELGPVATRFIAHSAPNLVTSEQIGAVAVAVSAAPDLPGQLVHLPNRAKADEALAAFGQSTR
ncbi:NADP-dependent 3-hydroxy acid dehydrogenase YdfG [Homoserinimonas aerilata]|uniref:NADP-dependent 3-hydroxy acid dehydrogenase YdfG n=1 Tax=Homoserinimonas aerilata TaxID=1162970 RepID=A0A542YJG3_9MICO|nr:SDR family oxidoreductase [Homoserinimonas aerilata]TQL48238.1 NADP-dependent 3-hydroxy acid dehydrogenase YdfG [Homoserinimonas aerilata]